MRIVTRLLFIVAGSAMFNAAVVDVVRSNQETGCKVHKLSPVRPALSKPRHWPKTPGPRPAECLTKNATLPSGRTSPTPAEPPAGSPRYAPAEPPSRSMSPTPAEPQDGERQDNTNITKLCANAMDKLGVEHWSDQLGIEHWAADISSWLSPRPPAVSLGYLYVPDTQDEKGLFPGTFQEVSLSRRDADLEVAKKAIRMCRSAAEQGDASAQLSLGIVYATGGGLPKNYAEAAKWWRKTADRLPDAANPHVRSAAQYNLGLLYGAGKGVPQNKTEAAKWMRSAADQRFPAAQYALGRMYSDGFGVPYDLIQAHMWLNLAGAQGYGDAIKQRDIVAVWIGSTTEIAEAERLAAAWSPTEARLAGEYPPKQ